MIGLWIITSYYVSIIGSLIASNFDNPKIQKVDPVDFSSLGQYVLADVSTQLIYSIMKGNVHWNNAEGGLHIDFYREPNIFVPEVYVLMSFLERKPMAVTKKNGAQSTSVAFKIAKHNITIKSKPYIVAEMSCNHIGKIEIIKDLIRAAAGAGANAVKLQTFKPNTMTIDCDRPDFMIRGGLWDGYKLFDLYKQAYTPWEWTGELFQLGNDLEVDIFSSPFDETAVDFLEQYAPPAYKIASLN